MGRRYGFSVLALLLTLAPSAALAVQAWPDLWPEVRRMFPEANRLGPPEGEPPAVLVSAGDRPVGYAFLTNDVLRIPAYSGRPINSLVGFDLAGKLRGVRIVEHEEPILVIGVHESDLERYVDQYAGLAVSDDIRIGGDSRPGRPTIDGISGATITVMVINRTVSQGLKEVASVRGLLASGLDGKARFAPPPPLWQELWLERRVEIVVLATGLVVLLLILLLQDWLARHPVLLRRVRTAYLWFTLLFIGIFAMAQLSVVNVLTFTTALLQGFQWDSFLLDPMLFVLWSFVAGTVLLWGRGVYCGWLCPFGALQELLFRLGQRLGVPEWEPPEVVHERLWAFKYIVLLALFGLSLQSLTEAERYAEVEPFKTVFALHFVRDWPYVVFALATLGVGLFIRKAYCRYLCPLGAALTFPTRFQIFDWLRRRKECGRPCQTCYRECEVRAIRSTGEIIRNECHYCLDCQITYWNDQKCPPLVEHRKKAELRARISEQVATD